MHLSGDNAVLRIHEDCEEDYDNYEEDCEDDCSETVVREVYDYDEDFYEYDSET